MPTTLLLPDGYGRVLASTVAMSTLSVFHYMQTGLLRRAAGVPYPVAYASEADAAKDAAKYRFNCAQRAQANYTENAPAMLVATLIAGLQQPQAAAGMAAAWTVARVLYMLGYTRAGSTAKDQGKARQLGGWGTLVLWAQLGLAGWVSWGMC